jgi:hypothetical protein
MFHIESKMKKIFFALLVLVSINQAAFGEPEIAWWRMYDADGEEAIYDVYAVANGDYIMCGHTGNGYTGPDFSLAEIWIVRVNNDGDVIWSGTYGPENGMSIGYSIIETDDGGFLVGAIVNREFAALRINEDGEEMWLNTYGDIICKSVIELKSGEYVLAGKKNRNGYLTCVDADGDVLWDIELDNEASDIFFSMRETEGGIIACGESNVNGQGGPLWIVKISTDGDLIWSRNHRIFERYVHPRTVVSTEQGFAISGFSNIGPGLDKNFFLAFIDDEGELDRTIFYDWDIDNAWDQDRCECMDRLNDGGFVMVGFSYLPLRHPIAFRATAAGVQRWQVDYDFPEMMEGFEEIYHRFHAVVKGHDNDILIAGTLNYSADGTGQNGLLMKL